MIELGKIDIPVASRAFSELSFFEQFCSPPESSQSMNQRSEGQLNYEKVY